MNIKNILKKLGKGETLTDAEKAFLQKNGYDADGNEVFTAGSKKKSIVAKDKVGEVVRMQFNVEEIKAVDKEYLKAVISSEAEDRHGEVLLMKGLDVKRYMTNPILAPFHNYNAVSVGITKRLTKTRDGKLIAEFKFATDIDGYDLPKILDQAYRKGYQFAFSIGFIPKDAEGNRFTKSEMIEFSPVLIGANDEALLKEFAKQKGLVVENIKKGEKPVSKKGDTKMLVLKEILAKIASGVALTAEEKAFLTEKRSELTAGQKAMVDEAIPQDKGKKDYDALSKKVDTLADSVGKMVKALDVSVTKKDINLGAGLKKKVEDLSKEEKTKLWFKALTTKNATEYNEVMGKTMNSTDDSALLPPEEFIAEVSRLEEEYGVAARFVNMRSTTNANMRGVKGGDNVELVKTAELGLKSLQETSYTPYSLAHLEYTGVTPVSDTLLEDSAIDVWKDLTNRFARANAKRQDQLVFVENDTADDVYGVLIASGTAQLSVGASLAAFAGTDAADLLNDMLYAVPTPSMSNGRYYFHRTFLGLIQKMRDTEGRSIWMPGINGPASGTIWGMPYELVEVLPSVAEVETGDAFLMFGDLKNTTLSIRTPMQTKFFDSGVITDSGGNILLNLMQQDAQAMRVRVRMNQVHVHPEAYSVLIAGDLS